MLRFDLEKPVWTAYTEAEWNACSESLIGALDKNKVGSAEKGELLGVVASLMKDIVGQ